MQIAKFQNQLCKDETNTGKTMAKAEIQFSILPNFFNTALKWLIVLDTFIYKYVFYIQQFIYYAYVKSLSHTQKILII